MHQRSIWLWFSTWTALGGADDWSTVQRTTFRVGHMAWQWALAHGVESGESGSIGQVRSSLHPRLVSDIIDATYARSARGP